MSVPGKYYKDAQLSDSELAARVTACSRHRHKHPPPATPEHFWSIGFPDTVDDRIAVAGRLLSFPFFVILFVSLFYSKSDQMKT